MKPYRWSTSLFLIGLAILALFLFNNQISQTLVWLQRPLVQAGTWLTRTTGILRSQTSLFAENADLQAKLISLAVFSSELEALRDENDNLRLQLGYLKQNELTAVTAAVIARSINPVSQTMVIDRGTAAGISLGDPVVVESGLMIGKIVAVNETSATVCLLSDRTSSVAATIENSSRTLGLVQGSGGSLLDFDYILQNADVVVNDLVVTSGLESDVPPGLVIGLINSIAVNQTEPFQQAVVEPLVDYRYYTAVSVITGGTEL